MKRAPIIEDWSRFNRAVMDVADGRSTKVPRKPPVPPPAPQPEHPPQEPGETDSYGLLARHRWRRHA